MIERGATKRMWLQRWNRLGEAIGDLLENRAFTRVLRVIFFPIVFLCFLYKNIQILIISDKARERSSAFDALTPVIALSIIGFFLGSMFLSFKYFLNTPYEPADEVYIQKVMHQGPCERRLALEIIKRNLAINHTTKQYELENMTKKCKNEEVRRQQAELIKDVK